MVVCKSPLRTDKKEYFSQSFVTMTKPGEMLKLNNPEQYLKVIKTRKNEVTRSFLKA